MTISRCSAARFMVFLAALVVCPPLAAARSDELVTAGAPGKIVDLPGGRGEGELLRFDDRLVPALLALAPEESAAIADWPVAPGVRRAVRLSRHEVWAEGARVFRVDAIGRTELPLSPLVFFWGGDTEGESRVLVTVDPRTRVLTALVHGPEGVNEIARDPADAAGGHLLAAPVRPRGATWTCAQEDLTETAWLPGAAAARSAEGRTAFVLGSLYKGILAIDTDKEYLAAFGNNTSNATSYIARLVASVNVMYERDLNLRLLVGTTILRTSSDPWTKTGSGASGAQLNEFTDYWNTNFPKSGTPRSFAALFSGKSTSSGISGVAWVPTPGSVCGGGLDYSFNQISAGGSWQFGDTLIVGHEIGHNMGSPHTHCYATPAPDHCYAGEACYSGATSCPPSQTINGVPSVTGTIMSYCHMLGGCSSSLVFHPSTVSRYVGPALDTGASTGCIALVVPPPPPPPSVSAATRFNAVAPCRVVDTRNAAGPFGAPSLGAGGLRSFVVTGVCNVPAGAVAVSANVTAVNPAATGNLIVYPNGIVSPPTVSALSFRAGRTRANNSLVYLASDGSFLVKNNAVGALDLVLDVNGYFK